MNDPTMPAPNMNAMTEDEVSEYVRQETARMAQEHSKLIQITGDFFDQMKALNAKIAAAREQERERGNYE